MKTLATILVIAAFSVVSGCGGGQKSGSGGNCAQRCEAQRLACKRHGEREPDQNAVHARCQLQANTCLAQECNK